MILATLIYFLAAVCWLIIFSRGSLTNTVVFTVLGTLLALLSVSNQYLGLFEAKFAGQFGLLTAIGEMNVPTFYVQALLLSPFAILSPHPLLPIVLNVVLSAFSITLCLSALTTFRNKILVFFIPSLFYFSMFGLRDPIIFLSLFFIAKLYFENGTRSMAFYFAVCILAVSRPELLIFPVALIILHSVHRVNRFAGFISLSLLSILSVPLLDFIPGLFGMSGIDVSAELLSDFAENRYERHAGDDDGGASHILGGGLFQLPFFQRFPIQFAAFFINPLPMDFRSVSMLIPLLDSLMFVVFLRFIWVANIARDKRGWVVILALFITVFAISFFSSNYGNLFRLRYPFFGVLFGLLSGTKERGAGRLARHGRV